MGGDPWRLPCFAHGLFGTEACTLGHFYFKSTLQNYGNKYIHISLCIYLMMHLFIYLFNIALNGIPYKMVYICQGNVIVLN